MNLTGDTRKIIVSNIKTVIDESNSAHVLVGRKPINVNMKSHRDGFVKYLF